jgi:hypothetical protein
MEKICVVALPTGSFVAKKLVTISGHLKSKVAVSITSWKWFKRIFWNTEVILRFSLAPLRADHENHRNGNTNTYG